MKAISVLVLCASLIVANADKRVWMCGVSTTVPDNFDAAPTVFGKSWDNYNVISFGDINAPSGDIEGAAATKNNLKVSAFTIGYERFTSGPGSYDNQLQYSAIVGHNMSWNGGSLHLGDQYAANKFAGAEEFAYVGEQILPATPGYLADRVRGTRDNIDSVFAAAQDYYLKVQSAFASLAANVVPTYSGQRKSKLMSINCGSASTAYTVVMSVSAADLAQVTSYEANNCHADNTYVFNIAGSDDITISGGGLPDSIKSENILINVIGAVTVTTKAGTPRGTLLAPQATYVMRTGVWIGNVIVKSVDLMNQINRVFCPVPSVPETPNKCIPWETECAGLKFTQNGQTQSFVEYNVVSFGEFNADTGDVEGRVAAAGDVTLGHGFSVGAELSTQDNTPDNSQLYSLISGGNVAWGSGSLHPNAEQFPHPGPVENMLIRGSFATNQTDLNDRVVQADDLSSIFDAAKTCYSGMSAALAALSQNVAHNVQDSGLFVTCNSADANQYVMNVSPQEFAAITYYNLANCNFQATWVINVVGTEDVTISGDSFPSVPAGTTYNVIGQRTVNLVDTSLRGNLLAVDADLYQPAGLIEGKVVVANVLAMNQINSERRCEEETDVLINVIASEDSEEGSDSIKVFYVANFRVEDISSAGRIKAINGDELTFDQALPAVNAGERFATVSVKSSASRAQIANEEPKQDSSAAVAGISAALLAVALLF